MTTSPLTTLHWLNAAVLARTARTGRPRPRSTGDRGEGVISAAIAANR